MRLLTESRAFLGWVGSLYRILLRHSPRAAMVTVVALVAAQFAQLLAFFIPLKVLILVGSDGVPRYLRSLIEPGTEMQWVAGLSVAAVAFYLLSIALDQQAGRSSRRGANAVLRNASKIVILNNQDESVQAYYRRICGALAAGSIVLVGLAIGLVLNAGVFLLLALIVVVEFVAVAAMLRASVRTEHRRFERWLVDNYGSLLKVMVAVSFLALFLLLLLEFLFVGDLNLIIAILSLLLGRRMLQSVAALVNGGVRLSRDRETVDALFVRERTLVESEDRPSRRLRELFSSEARQARTLAAFRNSQPAGVARLSSRWSDGGGVDTPQFDIQLLDAGGRVLGHAIEKVYFPRRRAQGKHEALLLEHADVDRLHAPRLIEEFVVEDFFGIRVAVGDGETPQSDVWRELHVRLLLDCWCYCPPDDLVESYMRSKPMLWARLDEESVGAVTIAAHHAGERDCVEQFVAMLDTIVQRIKPLPLFVHNPDLDIGNVRMMSGDEALVLNWGRWTIEPVGAGLRREGDGMSGPEALAATLRDRRHDAATVRASDLVLVARLMTLERMIAAQKYRQAISLMAQVLQHGASSR